MINKVNVSTEEMYIKYEEGLSLAAVAELFGFAQTSVIKRFKKKGYKLRGKNDSKIIKLDMEEVKRLYIEEKLPAIDIAAKLGVSRSLVAREINKAGFSRTAQESISYVKNNYTFWTKELDKEVKEYLEETQSLVLTSEKFNISPEALQFRNKEKWNINLSFWTKENELKAKKLLEQHKDYKIVSDLLGITERALVSKNFSTFKIDLSDNSNILGIPTVSNGIKYKSKLEARVADFLLSKNILFEREVRVCSERRWKCDFKINSLWIEMDGLGDCRALTGDIPYNKMNEKIEYYKKEKFNYVILPKDSWQKVLTEALDTNGLL